MSRIKSAIRTMLPKSFVLAYRDYYRARVARSFRRMSMEEVFTNIYSKNRWGGQSGTYYSGDGSHAASMVNPYVAKVTDELTRIGAGSMTAVDLGCGDYSVGQNLSPFCGQYVGVDIVAPLIKHNQEKFGSAKVSFQHLDIVNGDLPDGDVCFVREVLQHLSNAQIAAVLKKLEKFRWCFITEHQPSPDRLQQPNLDKPHNGDIRIGSGSGIFLEEPPFSVSTEKYSLLLEVPGRPPLPGLDPGFLRTYILRKV
jgi:hypothetical protein